MNCSHLPEVIARAGRCWGLKLTCRGRAPKLPVPKKECLAVSGTWRDKRGCFFVTGLRRKCQTEQLKPAKQEALAGLLRALGCTSLQSLGVCRCIGVWAARRPHEHSSRATEICTSLGPEQLEDLRCTAIGTIPVEEGIDQSHAKKPPVLLPVAGKRATAVLRTLHTQPNQGRFVFVEENRGFDGGLFVISSLPSRGSIVWHC